MEDRKNIGALHGEYFIADTIPRLIKLKTDGSKVKILDVGAGVGFYTDQIREKFGEKVEVFSTGLNKEQVNRYRQGTLGLDKLNPNDLKWSSIFQLSNFPEFDLIIDTYGEQFYFTEQGVGRFYSKIRSIDQWKKFKKYMETVIAKLNEGGHASIVSVMTSDADFYYTYIYYFIMDMEEKYNCKLKMQWDGEKGIFKIDKLPTQK